MAERGRCRIGEPRGERTAAQCVCRRAYHFLGSEGLCEVQTRRQAALYGTDKDRDKETFEARCRRYHQPGEHCRDEERKGKDRRRGGGRVLCLWRHSR